MEFVQEAIKLAQQILALLGDYKESAILQMVLNFVKNIDLSSITKILQSIIAVIPQ